MCQAYFNKLPGRCSSARYSREASLKHTGLSDSELQKERMNEDLGGLGTLRRGAVPGVVGRVLWIVRFPQSRHGCSVVRTTGLGLGSAPGICSEESDTDFRDPRS